VKPNIVQRPHVRMDQMEEGDPEVRDITIITHYEVK